MKPPYAIGSVPSLSGHAIAYRWRSLPRVRRHRASKPQGSSERVLPWQVTMDQLICCASLSQTYYWYEVGMLKVPVNEMQTNKQQQTDGADSRQSIIGCKEKRLRLSGCLVTWQRFSREDSTSHALPRVGAITSKSSRVGRWLSW